VAADEPGRAWDVARRDAKLAYLGPSFATKILYFAAFADTVPCRPAPLIADAVVAQALGLRRFTRDTYIAYCSEAARASRALDGDRCRADQIEYALFTRGHAS
jgi:hypothetical protein